MSDDGRWAVITGATSGIGRALAFEFASGGFHVFLTGRNEEALAQVAAACAGTCGVQTDSMAADLARPECVEALVAALASRPRRYEVLVNNAGFGVHGSFASTDVCADLDLLHVQLAASLRLTKALLPAMLARRSGHILNVASVYSFAPVPFQAVYGACKAFLMSFSSSLRSELKGTGVGVTLFCPGVTQTEFRARAGIPEKRRDAGMTAAAAAHAAYRATLRDRAIIVPGLVNRVFVRLAGLLPAASVPEIVRFINRRRGHADS